MTTDDIKIQPGQPKQAAKTTIVGGQPPGNQRYLTEVPVGLEQLLAMAASNEEFAEALQVDLDTAVAASGVALSDTERAVLRATPVPMMKKMIDRVETLLPRPERRIFLERAAAALALLLGAGGLAACKEPGKGTKSGGASDPMDAHPKAMDMPRPMDAMRASLPERTAGIRPDAPPAGIRPDAPRPRPKPMDPKDAMEPMRPAVPQAGATIERPPAGSAGVRAARPMVPKKRRRPRKSIKTRGISGDRGGGAASDDI